MRVHSSARKPGAAQLRQQHHTHALFTEVLSIMAQMVRGEEELLNKVIIFVFFVHKKYSCSFELMYK